VATSEELVWLLHQIRNSGSPIERLKLLARGWRSVRKLSPDDRRRLARELGFDGAEELIEQLAHRGGMSPSNLLSMLHRAEQSDPAVVLDSVRGLVRPERRGAAAGELLDTVSEILVEGEAPGTREPEPSGEPAREAEAEQEAPPAPAPEPTLRLEPSTAAVPGAGGEPAQAPLAERPEVGEPAVVRPAPATARRRPAPPEWSGARDIAEAFPSRSDAALLPGYAAVGTASGLPSAAGLASQLGAESSLLRRLRLLTAAAGRLEAAGLEELQAVLACFPAGWARRRALQRLLEAGVPASLTDAIALLEVLPRLSERLWAATTLAATRRLDEQDREALLAAVASPALRHRLKRRFGGGMA